jgi:hypothetical protein
MGAEEHFAEALKLASDKRRFKSILIGKAVNITATKCDVEREGEATLLDVLFHTVEDAIESYMVVKPKDGSQVIVGIIENQEAEAIIIQTSEIDQVSIKIGNKEFTINEEGHLIAAGNDTLLKGLIKLIDAVKATVVIQGRNPDPVKLQDAKEIFENILQ